PFDKGHHPRLGSGTRKTVVEPLRSLTDFPDSLIVEETGGRQPPPDLLNCHCGVKGNQVQSAPIQMGAVWGPSNFPVHFLGTESARHCESVNGRELRPNDFGVEDHDAEPLDIFLARDVFTVLCCGYFGEGKVRRKLQSVLHCMSEISPPDLNIKLEDEAIRHSPDFCEVDCESLTFLKEYVWS